MLSLEMFEDNIANYKNLLLLFQKTLIFLKASLLSIDQDVEGDIETIVRKGIIKGKIPPEKFDEAKEEFMKEHFSYLKWFKKNVVEEAIVNHEEFIVQFKEKLIFLSLKKKQLYWI